MDWHYLSRLVEVYRQGRNRSLPRPDPVLATPPIGFGLDCLEPVHAPALFWVSFYVEQLGLDVVPVDPDMQVLLLPGESKTLDSIFVVDADGPVTQLPDTGAGEYAIGSYDP